jgi:hypothetical protein
MVVRAVRAILAAALWPLFVGPGCSILDASDDCTFTKTCPPQDAGTPPPSDACPGTCVPNPHNDFSDPYLVWMGEGQPASDICGGWGHLFDGTAPPSALVCPACKCLSPSGSCALPATATASASTCPSTPGLPLPAPSGWDGSCTGTQGLVVFEDGVESVTVAPLVPIDGPCAPQMITDTKDPHPGSWPYVSACKGSAMGTCPSADDVCMPLLPPGPKTSASMWTYCVSLADPTSSCPMDTFPIRRDFSDGWTNLPTCTPCTCGAAVGSSCSPSTVTLYSDDACTDAVGESQAQTSTSTCVDVTADSLGSMTATPSMYMPGMCPHSGGEVTGGPPVATLPMVFCCQE